MGSTSSGSDSDGFSTDVSDWVRGRARQMCSQTVWELDYSPDVSNNWQWKGRRVIKSNADVA